ncbi:MAG: hypothetical protein SVS85_02710 [Candidatus Nanohaloarchaea archaeon]|nr:hypothetical protein [Candidatus Nanohaloarchaea archaeon]
MNCGIVLSGDTEEDSAVAFVDGGETETFSVSTNDEILELLEDRKPEVTALNAPPEKASKGSIDRFREGEQELVDEGHRLLPQGMRDGSVLERAEHLSRSIEASGVGTVIVESDPVLVSERMGLAGDEGLEDLGVETGTIEDVREYDAVVLAVAAELYSDNRCENHGIVVPEEGVDSI